MIDIPPDAEAELTPWERAIWGAESLAPRIVRALSGHAAVLALLAEEAAATGGLGAPPYWEAAHWSSRWDHAARRPRGDA